MSSAQQIQKGGVKNKIICKYFILGKCTKGESCPYLHSQIEKPIEKSKVECPMYSIGFCKNGPLCHFLHIKKDNLDVEEKNEKNNLIIEGQNLSNFVPEESKIMLENEKKEENEKVNEKKEENEDEKKKNVEFMYPEIPIWYIEHYFDKPLAMIYSELEMKNLPEIVELKKKYGFTNIEPNLPIMQPINKKNKININMNTLNLSVNNFNMNFAFNNNYKDRSISKEKDIEPYKYKKDSIEMLINKDNDIFYYLIKYKKAEEIKNSSDTNTIKLPEELYNLYKDKDLKILKLTVILLIYDEESSNFSGFAKLKYPLIQEDNQGNQHNINNYKIEWLWIFIINYNKVLLNRADNDHFLNEGRNGCPIDKDLGNYCCRLMIKRLSKDEVKELMNEKKIFQNQKMNDEKDKKNIERKENNSNKKYNNNIHNSSQKEYKKHKDNIEYSSNSKKYLGHKKHRNNSRSRSNYRKKDSEDYSYNKYKNSNDKKYKYNYKEYKNHSNKKYYHDDKSIDFSNKKKSGSK